MQTNEVVIDRGRWRLAVLLVPVILVALIGWPSPAPADAHRQAFFGELHMHTALSLDAYLFGVRATPDDAYEFAKGRPLQHPLGQVYRISRPLDFMAVTDHAVYMGSLARMTDKDHPISSHALADRINDPDPAVRRQAYEDFIAAGRAGTPVQGLGYEDVYRDAWEQTIAAANRHYEPGRFTTFIGYEWSGTPQGRNLHRNVIFLGDSAPLPFSRLDSLKPEDLWAWMDEIRKQGHEALAIPHNANLSDGLMFALEDSWQNPLTADYAAMRNRNEPLVEVTQVKGTSETHPALSPNDEFANFELVEQLAGQSTPVTRFAGGYVRDAYASGLALDEMQGFNPFRFGLIGSTDSHTGIVTTEEDAYSGKIGAFDGLPSQRLDRSSFDMDVAKFSASGLAGVWAEENTRESIYDALRRKETWSTTGPRIRVRFFGGVGLDDIDFEQREWADKAYRLAVPMGGDIVRCRDKSPPTFIAWALKDPDGANLDRIQIVKIWSESGEQQERVYDVAWSGDRSIDPSTGNLEAVGDTVDRETLWYENSIGSPELLARWTDPDFDPDQNAAYYVRVLEIPTPRWSLFDARALGIPNRPDLPETIQERAFTSPIWYRPADRGH